MSITSPADLAAIRPIDITNQEHFDQLLASIPRPVPPEWKVQYGRMNAIARRHGYAWPYAIRIANPKSPVVSRPKPAPTPDTYVTRSGPHGGVVAEPMTQSRWHIIDHDGWEYFDDNDGYAKRAPLSSPVDLEERHRVIGIEEPCAYADWPALYEELTGEKYHR